MGSGKRACAPAEVMNDVNFLHRGSVLPRRNRFTKKES